MNYTSSNVQEYLVTTEVESIFSFLLKQLSDKQSKLFIAARRFNVQQMERKNLILSPNKVPKERVVKEKERERERSRSKRAVISCERNVLLLVLSCVLIRLNISN